MAVFHLGTTFNHTRSSFIPHNIAGSVDTCRRINLPREEYVAHRNSKECLTWHGQTECTETYHLITQYIVLEQLSSQCLDYIHSLTKTSTREDWRILFDVFGTEYVWRVKAGIYAQVVLTRPKDSKNETREYSAAAKDMLQNIVRDQGYYGFLLPIELDCHQKELSCGGSIEHPYAIETQYKDIWMAFPPDMQVMAQEALQVYSQGKKIYLPRPLHTISRLQTIFTQDQIDGCSRYDAL